MNRQTNRQREALRSYQECRDMEAGLLDRNGINPLRILIGVVAGATFIALAMALWFELVRVFP